MTSQGRRRRRPGTCGHVNVEAATTTTTSSSSRRNSSLCAKNLSIVYALLVSSDLVSGFSRVSRPPPPTTTHHLQRYSVPTSSTSARTAAVEFHTRRSSQCFFTAFDSTTQEQQRRLLQEDIQVDVLSSSSKAAAGNSRKKGIDAGVERRRSKKTQKTSSSSPPSSSSASSGSTAAAAARIAELPAWLQREEASTTPKQMQAEIQWLEFALLEHGGFQVGDVSDIVKAIYFCGAGDIEMIVGILEFCKLMLRLEDDANQKTTTTNKNDGEDDKFYSDFHMFMTKDVLLASILHYTECVTARRDGVYESVQQALLRRGVKSSSMNPTSGTYQRILQGSVHSKETSLNEGFPDEDQVVDAEFEVFPESSIVLRRKLTNKISSQPANHVEELEGLFTPEALRLAQAASTIKRAEILAEVVLTEGRILNQKEFTKIRDLLLTVMEDWRGLAIRCVASLYRLEGILAKTMPRGTGDYYLPRSSEAMRTARQSIRVYASLSQRLGLHRLKSQLEGNAFRILYPRQYNAVSTLFQQKGESMQAISSFLSSQIVKMLQEDEYLSNHLEDFEVSSRVKEPYSFWKKRLKNKHDGQKSGSSGAFLSPAAAQLSVIDVQDAVALRVILKPRKSVDESHQVAKSREHMLCYYVHHLIRTKWPPTDNSRVKDYIQNPKPNGYQSLHHTSVITRNNQELPFEVQVRSEEMHRIAEFGVAAHWDYKFRGSSGGTMVPTLPPASAASTKKEATLALPKQSHDDGNKVDRKEVLLEVGDDQTSTSSSYLQALENARDSLVRSNVYVFLAGTSSSALKDGHLLSVPVGAHVADVLAELRTTLDDFPLHNDDAELHIWRNGQLSLPEEVVRNGDVLLLQDLGATKGESKNGDLPTTGSSLVREGPSLNSERKVTS